MSRYITAVGIVVSVFAVLVVANWVLYATADQAQSLPTGNGLNGQQVDTGKWKKPDPGAIREMLSDEQYRVTQEEATERPFKNAYWDNKQQGIYVDVVSGEPLFSSADKFKSGTGWPSFTRPLVGNLVVEKKDWSWGMRRTEVRSRIAESHLGHLFSDGPQPTGLRYCINSASLRFIPRDKLAEEGYPEFLSLFE